MIAAPTHRVKTCKRVSVTPDGIVGLRASAEHGCGFSGVATCGSTWACPLCSARIAFARAREVKLALEWARKHKYEVLFVTLTARHNKGHRLKTCWKAVAQGWKRATGGKQWVADQKRYGVVGWLRTFEVTYGDEHGWHVHVHALIFVDRGMSLEVARGFGDLMFARWASGLESVGLSALRRTRAGEDVGVKVLRARDYVSEDGWTRDGSPLGDYFTKMTYELTHGGQKHGRETAGQGRHRSPFQILADMMAAVTPATGELRPDYDADRYEDDLALWQEWERESKGRRQLEWSRNGIKQRVGVTEVTDEQAAEENAGDDDLLILPRETWRAVRWVAWQLKAYTEEHGVAGAREWLERRGLAYEQPTGVAAAAARQQLKTRRASQVAGVNRGLIIGLQ